MTGDEIALLVVAVALVLVGGLAASADASLSRVSRVRADELVRDGRRGSTRLQQLVTDPAPYLNALLLVRVTCELTATVLVAELMLGRMEPAWQAVLVTVVVMVPVSYIAVGVSPRTLGRQHAEAVGLASAGMVRVLARVLGPVPRLLILLGNALTPGKGLREGPFASEAELRDLVDLAEKSRVIESGEREMIHSVFELGDTLVREVMVPRTDVVFIERQKTLRQALSLALRSGFSRIPVIGENLDDVVGIVYLKDLIARTYDYHEGESTERVESVMRPATFVPDSKPVDDLLREMQAARIHVAVVVDEYGGCAGLATIEDILEEIVGEITDEYDVEAAPVEDLGDGVMRVTARLPVEELARVVGLDLADEDVETVGGLLAKHLGRVPIPGASVHVDSVTLTAESAAGRRNRIGTVLVTPDPTRAANGAGGSGRTGAAPGTGDVQADSDTEAVNARHR